MNTDKNTKVQLILRGAVMKISRMILCLVAGLQCSEIGSLLTRFREDEDLICSQSFVALIHGFVILLVSDDQGDILYLLFSYLPDGIAYNACKFYEGVLLVIFP